jgi:hypothetical protein
MRMNVSSVSSRTWIHPLVNSVTGTGKTRSRCGTGTWQETLGPVARRPPSCISLNFSYFPVPGSSSPVSSTSSSAASRSSALSICLIFLALALMWYLPVREDLASEASRSIHEITLPPPAARGSLLPGRVRTCASNSAARKTRSAAPRGLMIRVAGADPPC